MNITAALLAPFTWVHGLFTPKISLEVENAIEQLGWNPSNFELVLEKQAGTVVVFIKSIETLWSFPDDEPTSVCIAMTPDDCWLFLPGGQRHCANSREKLALVKAVQLWTARSF